MDDMTLGQRFQTPIRFRKPDQLSSSECVGIGDETMLRGIGGILIEEVVDQSECFLRSHPLSVSYLLMR
jgi:hypothetical protein